VADSNPSTSETLYRTPYDLRYQMWHGVSEELQDWGMCRLCIVCV